MSASVREPGRVPSKDEPPKNEALQYAPKKARHPGPASDPAGAPAHGGAVPRSAMPEGAEPPWKRSWQRSGATFGGEVAVAELRTRLSLAPDRLPEPPPPSSGGSRLVW